ncbi:MULTISPECIES: PadR family transcriptional regulator [Gordonibacter]|uniref:Helix-turn-helix transcriptional regulator n=1 Tax=Gordonibacter faecis TaxID=3047475 RepID=A0ABT7DT24_9ACTN|nr:MULTISPECIES: helix-turn-helix transcriptional regulator [unclassified Gordonibacter]MDJ1651676.1 helix-turn-helix transcriptional regulator [Gordonibacter sp. KGMB12511]HIW77099.1 PadR family transcriptional regulator [Candidatus Gordonibacter avicola]
MAKRSPYETGELSDSIFLILMATLEPVHGYRIMQVVKESLQGEVEIGPATMYTTLKKLKAAGWIVEVADDAGDDEAGEGVARILYVATDEGRCVLQHDLTRRKRLIAMAEERLGATTEENHGEV